MLVIAGFSVLAWASAAAAGVIALATSAVGFCPLYRLFGLNTCRVRRD